ncbi:type II toxin-antitoxin system HicB family antitoxin [Paenibacillus oceani]|uniref:Type II toxin-antitoxin system HicB family antitoxin n=1 Tax=Paenibacillus oceani TaxID=2772510 RepID=A0A927CFE9_9BACL|nr:type II toxin-antitoxin system HicB family antitoxin [Paenibacillus oceani]MBD2864790.1 type II toxin-antitoxin system HicB family antitoxin [Paenibacillus oceani]
MDRYVFPALFESEEGVPGYTVSFPDLPGCHTEGDTLEEALSMAREALGLHLYGMEEDGDEIPVASAPGKLQPVEDGFYTLIEVRTGPVRDKQLNKSVTKNVTLPRWLELEATKAELNFSQVLQHALKQELRIFDKNAK